MKRCVDVEQLLRALLWKVPYRIEGERLLMEELDYNVLLPVVRRIEHGRPGLEPDDVQGNRDRLLGGEAAVALFDALSLWPARRVCSPTSTSPSAARSWRLERAGRVSVRARVGRAAPQTTQ